jgi:hypothetical protein
VVVLVVLESHSQTGQPKLQLAHQMLMLVVEVVLHKALELSVLVVVAVVVLVVVVLVHSQ